jgi:hypothetical protein
MEDMPQYPKDIVREKEKEEEKEKEKDKEDEEEDEVPTEPFPTDFLWEMEHPSVVFQPVSSFENRLGQVLGREGEGASFCDSASRFLNDE